ncbi:MAG: hypothetical protein KC636_20355 [Myxococcales bacterium]|nr:hypothetical protein [Myxococcales bacterium]
MDELVTLHTQEVTPPLADTYLALLRKTLRAARLNSSYPERHGLDASLQALGRALAAGIYGELYLDSRVGLPNLATLTRVLTDQEVAAESLRRMGDRAALDARRDEAEVFARLVAKHDYYTELGAAQLAPVDRHRVFLRRHDPARGEAAFRIELTKLDGSGQYLRVTVELSQVASSWRTKVIALDEDGESAAASQAFRATVYRCAHLDAETLFVHLAGIEGVTVERVIRGVVGPVLFALPREGGRPIYPLEPADDALGRGFARWLATHRQLVAPAVIATFALDQAAADIRDEKSNDPLAPLLRDRLVDAERARYEDVRSRHRFRVYRDRKFVVSPPLRPVADEIMRTAGTRNTVYNLR